MRVRSIRVFSGCDEPSVREQTYQFEQAIALRIPVEHHERLRNQVGKREGPRRRRR
jgi:hypothetical protein